VELEYSLAGRLGRAIEPVFRPLGFDWKLSVGVLSSFAAREVIVSTTAVLYGLGSEGADDGVDSLIGRLRDATRPDGTLVFTTATCVSLLVFYVLAMQCLPTQAVARRETGTWKWPLVQLGYMTALAYVAALVAYQIVGRLGV
jgi:ferrous iron transport protein B